MSEYVFYYDETEHSRKINYKTVSASNYYDNFITVIVGWEKAREEQIKEKYHNFEEKYSSRKNGQGELKSTTLNQKKFQFGLASQDQYNIQFIQDFLSIFDENIHVYFSVSSKIEFIIMQLFSEYQNSMIFDADAMKYTITKTLNVYRPQDIIDCLCNSPSKFVDAMISFFKRCIEHNKDKLELKLQENQAFEEIISYLKEVNNVPQDEWDYHMPFDGFLKYLHEEKIEDCHLFLDKEGKQDSRSKTLQAAIEVGLENVSEADSIEMFGLRMADMFAGILAKLMKALKDSLSYNSFEEANQKKILDNNWFCLSNAQFRTYKDLCSIICKWDHAWYKAFAGNYSDDLIVFIALLQYIDHFETAAQIKEDLTMQGEFFNGFVCEQLKQYFIRRKNKLQIEPINASENDFFYNKKGAKFFYDVNRQPTLAICNSVTVDVLSVGVGKIGQPLVTINENGNTVCYRLPVALTDWAMTLVGMASMGDNFFPTKVRFSKVDSKFYADIL